MFLFSSPGIMYALLAWLGAPSLDPPPLPAAITNGYRLCFRICLKSLGGSLVT